jgi:hypothetical protein
MKAASVDELFLEHQSVINMRYPHLLVLHLHARGSTQRKPLRCICTAPCIIAHALEFCTQAVD